MSRPVRIEFPGACYHVTGRGLNHREVFADQEDQAVFINVLDNVVDRFGWLLHSYVLMADHYHLVVEVPSANLSKGMRQLNGVYTQHFNRRHETVGPLFQGRFKSILFEKKEYLLPLCRHVVLNPVRADKPSALRTYRWSSHRAMKGEVRGSGRLYRDDVLGAYGKRVADSEKKYARYVKDGIGLPSPLEERTNQVLLGTPKFLREMAPILAGEKMAKRGPQRATRRRSLKSLFKNVGDKTRAERNALIARAHLEFGYTLMEIGDHLDLHYTTVSKVINA